MTRRKPGKRWRRTGNEEDPNKRPRRTAQLVRSLALCSKFAADMIFNTSFSSLQSSLPEASNVHVETDQQYLGKVCVCVLACACVCDPDYSSTCEE